MTHVRTSEHRSALREAVSWRPLCALAVLLCASQAAIAADASIWAIPYPAVAAGTAAADGRAAAPKHGAAEKKDDKKWEVDSEHIFGFTVGSDIGEKGELEFEFEPVGAIKKRFGTYFATAQPALFKYTVTDSFRIAPAFLIMSHHIQDVPDIDNRHGTTIGGALTELRYRFLDREKAPFGLTLSVEPAWARIDEMTGESVEQYASDFAILADKEIIKDRLYGAFNFSYDLSATRLKATGEWTHDSGLAEHLALSYQFIPGMLVGGEARYLRQYEGLGLDRLKGEALYMGPTFFMKLGETANLSASWNFQVWGKALDEPGDLDLVNFERYQILLRLAMLLNAK